MAHQKNIKKNLSSKITFLQVQLLLLYSLISILALSDWSTIWRMLLFAKDLNTKLTRDLLSCGSVWQKCVWGWNKREIMSPCEKQCLSVIVRQCLHIRMSVCVSECECVSEWVCVCGVRERVRERGGGRELDGEWMLWMNQLFFTTP